MTAYSHRAQPYIDALANSLFSSQKTRDWLFTETPLETLFAGSASLHEEQRQRRRPMKQPFYCNYWCGKDKLCACRVEGAKGLETDMMAFFENPQGKRAGVSFEVKSPNDKLSPGQAACYPLRAECWRTGRTGYSAIVPHDVAMTVIVAPDHDMSIKDMQHFQKRISYSEAYAVVEGWPDGV